MTDTNLKFFDLFDTSNCLLRSLACQPEMVKEPTIQSITDHVSILVQCLIKLFLNHHMEAAYPPKPYLYRESLPLRPSLSLPSQASSSPLQRTRGVVQRDV